MIAFLSTLVVSLALYSQAHAKPGKVNGTPINLKRIDQFDRLGDEFTAKRLVDLTQFEEIKNVQTMRSSRDPQSIGLNPNNKLPYKKKDTDHDLVSFSCLAFDNTGNCVEWTDPYIPREHGEAEDSSPLEREITKAWLKLKNTADASKAGDGKFQYGIWIVEKKDPRETDISDNNRFRSENGRAVIDRSKIKSMDLNPQVKEIANKIGNDEMEDFIRKSQSTYGNSPTADQKSPMNEVDQRVTARALSLFLRNRMGQIMGELRADSPGIRFKLGFNPKDCEGYYQIAKNNPLDPRIKTAEWALNYDTAPLIPPPDLESRLEACQALARADFNMINPQFDPRSKAVVEGKLEDQQIDYSLAFAQLRTIDSLGAKTGDIPLPSYLGLTDEDFKAKRYECQPGGGSCKIVRELNDKTRTDYNELVRYAQKQWNEMAKLSPSVGKLMGTEEEVLPKGANVVEVNGLTPVMQKQFKNTELAQVIELGVRGEDLEQSPVELTDPNKKRSTLVVKPTTK